MTGSARRKRPRPVQPFDFLAGVIITMAVVTAWRFFAPEETPNLILLFDDVSCRTFTVFHDPSLDELPRKSAVRIPPDTPQAIRVPDGPVSFSFWDLNGNGAYKTALEVGTFGSQGARIGYTVLAIGAERPCGRDELQGEWMESATSLFERNTIVQPN